MCVKLQLENVLFICGICYELNFNVCFYGRHLDAVFVDVFCM